MKEIVKGSLYDYPEIDLKTALECQQNAPYGFILGKSGSGRALRATQKEIKDKDEKLNESK